VHVAVPGLPDVTVDALHPVLRSTPPSRLRSAILPVPSVPHQSILSADRRRQRHDCPEIDGFALEVTTVAAVA